VSPDPAPATPVIRGKVLFLIENASAPGDRRSWMDAQTLVEAGCKVSIISPRRVYKKFHERLDGISIYRYPLPAFAGTCAVGGQDDRISLTWTHGAHTKSLDASLGSRRATLTWTGTDGQLHMCDNLLNL